MKTYNQPTTQTLELAAAISCMDVISIVDGDPEYSLGPLRRFTGSIEILDHRH